MWRNENPCALLGGTRNGAAAVGDTTGPLNEVTHGMTTWSSNCASRSTPPKMQQQTLGCVYARVLSSVIHKSQRQKPKRPFRRNVVCPHYGISLLKLKKEWNSGIGHETWKHHTAWNQPDTKGQSLHDSTFMRYLEFIEKVRFIEKVEQCC